MSDLEEQVESGPFTEMTAARLVDAGEVFIEVLRDYISAAATVRDAEEAEALWELFRASGETLFSYSEVW